MFVAFGRNMRVFFGTLSEPVYRSKLLVFGLLGGVLIALSTAVHGDPLRAALAALSVTIWGVALVQVLWEVVGGDPLSERIAKVEQSVDNGYASLGRSLAVLADLVDGRIGIERVWAARRQWQRDARSGLAVWQDRLCRGSATRIVSNTLWSWLNDTAFRRRFLEHIERDGATAQIVLYHPMEPVVLQRSADEGEGRFSFGDDEHGVVAMQMEIRESLRVLAEAVRDWDESTRSRLQIRLTDRYPHMSQIIWVDEWMLVALYLSGRSGGHSPTLEIRGPSAYFGTYSEQFDIVWKRGRPLLDEELACYL